MAVAGSPEHHTGHPAVLDAHPSDRFVRAHLATVGADRLDEPRSDRLAAAFRVERAAHVVVGEPGVERDRRARGRHGVVALLAEQHGPRPRREPVRVEELGDRAEPPLDEARRLREQLGRLTALPAEQVAVRGHLAHRVDHPAERSRLIGEGREQPGAVAVPARGHAEREVGEDEGAEAVRIERAEGDPVGQTRRRAGCG